MRLSIRSALEEGGGVRFDVLISPQKQMLWVSH